LVTDGLAAAVDGVESGIGGNAAVRAYGYGSRQCQIGQGAAGSVNGSVAITPAVLDCSAVCIKRRAGGRRVSLRLGHIRVIAINSPAVHGKAGACAFDIHAAAGAGTLETGNDNIVVHNNRSVTVNINALAVCVGRQAAAVKGQASGCAVQRERPACNNIEQGKVSGGGVNRKVAVGVNGQPYVLAGQYGIAVGSCYILQKDNFCRISEGCPAAVRGGRYGLSKTYVEHFPDPRLRQMYRNDNQLAVLLYAVFYRFYRNKFGAAYIVKCCIR